MPSVASALRRVLRVGRLVVIFRPPGGARAGEHEAVTQTAVAQMLAAAKGCEMGDVCESVRRYPPGVFFVPRDTLLAAEAAGLGIRSADDLFGGVVPHAFARTKAITHALVGPGAARPAGWSDDFASAVGECALPGFTAFALDDARVAAGRLLADGPARMKPPLAAGGRGQRVGRTADEMDAVLNALDPGALAEHGVVLEANLADVVTYSIGQVTVDGQTISYVGTQGETRDNAGRHVYGGSELTVVRGGWAALDRLDPEPLVRQAIACAVRYDVATRVLPGFFASRRNYDVAAGVDGRGRRRLGVLEASWRPGGASPAEVVAFRALRDDPTLDVVGVATVERYGDALDVPGDALVHFRGHDSAAGPVVRYTRIQDRRAA